MKGLYENVFWINNVFHAMSYRIFKSNIPYTLQNNLTRKKTKSQKKFVIADQIRKIEKILQNKSLKNCAP